MVNRTFVLFMFGLFSTACFSKDSTSYYFIYLKDKKGTEYSLSDPFTFLSPAAIQRRFLTAASNEVPDTLEFSDLPVSKKYLSELANVSGIRVIKASKWLNAVQISTEPGQGIEGVKALSFVQKVEFLGTIRNWDKPGIDSIKPSYYDKANVLQNKKNDTSLRLYRVDEYGKSYRQNNLLNADYLQSFNMGRNMHIAVLDAGFHNAYKVNGMEDLLMPDVIIRDFVDYDNSVWENDEHGAKVLSFMKTYDPGNYIGTAPMAKYTLLRTEIGNREYPVEEVNWLFAAEFADSLGVDLIVSSLGYHTFDDPSLSHTHGQLDGKTSIIAQAANMAHRKGIMVITSAGNEGQQKWHKIGTPADATGVMSVGACDESGFHVGFSSCGPSADNRVKPDFTSMGFRAMVSAPLGVYAGNGTSYSTPILGGSVACLMQACPDKTFEEIRTALQMSSTHYFYPDSAYGYGIPDFRLALNMLGKFKASDTATDIFYERTEPTYFQNMGIHFWSKKAQTVKVTISGISKKKVRKISSRSFNLKAGGWLHDGMLMQIYQEESTKRKNRLKSVTLTIETASGTYQKSITLIYF